MDGSLFPHLGKFSNGIFPQWQLEWHWIRSAQPVLPVVQDVANFQLVEILVPVRLPLEVNMADTLLQR